MSQHDEDICLRLQVLNSQNQPLGGTVDIACKLQNEADTFYIRAANAAQEIDVRGLRRDAAGPYQVTVTAAGTGQSASQLIAVPASGAATMQFVIGAQQGPPNTLSGILVFDHGLRAANVVPRLYSIGFANRDTLLGQTTSGTGGKYSISYPRPGAVAVNLQVRVLNPDGSEVTLSN